jgi:hypothetical protein
LFQLGQVSHLLEDTPDVIGKSFDSGLREYAGQHTKQRICCNDEKGTAQRTPLEDTTLDTEEEELLAIEIREAPVVGIESSQKPHQLRGGSHRLEDRKDKAVRDAGERGRVVQQNQEGHQLKFGIVFRCSFKVGYPRSGVQGRHVVEPLTTFSEALLRVVRVARYGFHQLPIDRCSHPFVYRFFAGERPSVSRLSPFHQLGVVVGLPLGRKNTYRVVEVRRSGLTFH